MLLLLTPAVLAQVAPAGTDIVNQALADYFDGVNSHSTASNRVNTRVLPVFQINLSPPGTEAAPAYSLGGAPRDTVYCRFDVTNLGNARDSVWVTSAVTPQSAWVPDEVILFRDGNGNGVFDAGEDDPAFLALASGASVPLDVGVVLAPDAYGVAHVGVAAMSTADPTVVDVSVLRVTAVGASLLHVGPAGNPRALPGGEGSADDVTRGPIDYDDLTFTFENEVLNESPAAQLVEIVLPDLATVAPGVVLSVVDSTGSVVDAAPASARRFLLGSIPANASRRFLVEVTSTDGEPLFRLPRAALSLRVTARSLSDSTQYNATIDRLVPPGEVNPAAVVSLRQTFHETVASMGDVVTLVVTVENITDSLRVDDVDVSEFVQPQLSFVSSRDFIWSNGRLEWAAGTLGGGESKTAVAKFVANSRVRVGKAKAVGSVAGVAESGDAVWAGPVVSSIKLDNDVFGEEGVILGDVFVDADGNGRRGPRERGVANVAVYLESGEYAVTDSSGAFSIPRAFAGYRMVRLDETGLPAGVRIPEAGARRHNERLVHLLAGGHARVSFALREDAGAGVQPLPSLGSAPVIAVEAFPEPEVSPEGEREVAFVEPLDGRVFTSRDRIRVRAGLPLGSRTILRVNGESVPESRVGQRTVDVSSRVEQIVWYGVQIRTGWNTLVLQSRLIDGGSATDTVRVALSSRPAALTAARERVLIPADGRERETLAFDVVDGLGLPVADGLVANVVQGEDIVDADDARPDTRGLQVLVAGGRIVLATRPRNDTGRGVVAVECEGFTARTDVSFVASRTPFFATGLVGVRIGAFSKSGDGSGVGVDGYRDGVGVEGESRLFVQGAIPHGLNLTARLDSRRRYDDPLLKDVNTERQYPVFGDASSLHFAAPSQGGNFISVDRGESFVRYGDFRTPLDGGEFLAYRRASTGLTSSFVRGRSSFQTFVTRTDFSTHQDELPADGTSGFYYLSRSPIVEHTERIVLETRDRFRSEKVLEVLPMIRNRDYTINYFDGSVLFKEPVAAVDRDFNPVRIVATYEVETAEEAQYLYGARAGLTESERYRVGTTAVARSGDGQNYALYGVDGEARLTGPLAGLRLSGEVARSDDGATGAGNAFKAAAAYEGHGQHHELYLRRVDGDFNNPSLRGAASELSSLKTGFQSALGVGPDIRLEADGYIHRLDRTGEEKENLRVVGTYRHSLMRMTAGARAARHEQPEGNNGSVLTIAGVAVGGEGSGRPGIATVWEKNLTGEYVEDYPDRLKTQGRYPLTDRLEIVGGHEYLTASGRGGSHQATAGLESRLNKSTSAYSRYSMNRTAGGDRMGAVTGLEHRLRLREGLGGMLGTEFYQSLSDRPDDEYVTVKSGLDARQSERYLIEGQYEYRWQTRRTKHLVRLNAARQLANGFAALLTSVLSVAPDADTDDELGFHGKLALAQRPSAGVVHSLWMLRNDYERFTPANPDAVNWRLVFSGDVNLMPAVDHELRMKYAFKHVENWSYDVSHSVDADLVLGQYVYRFARGWDVDLWGRLVRQRNDGSMEAGSGIEVGRMLVGTLRVAACYSINGFEDPDFAGTDAWASGFSLRLQLLVSEWLFEEVGRGAR